MYLPTHDLPFFYALPEEFAKTGIFKINKVGMFEVVRFPWTHIRHR